MSERLERAMAAIDAANADDPEVLDIDGISRPKEVVHSEMMTAWVKRLLTTPTDAQLLAARANHLRRWVVPRADYPEGRAGYLRWRKDQQRRQSDEVALILRGEGYDEATIERVGAVIRKEGLAAGDPEVQAHEDALCLTFLETQLATLADQLGDDKMIAVLQRTLKKMSAGAMAEAAALPLGERERRLVLQAIGAH